MIYFLIGHRGSGKSHLARRLPGYFQSVGQEVLITDLDQTIESGEGLSISEIFESQGEKAFRDLEEKYLQELCSQYRNETRTVVIVVGAGYLGTLPPLKTQNALCLWIRRPTDSNGRIFLDRPRLNPKQSPLDEFLTRAKEREPRYRRHANEQLMISEGFERSNPEERAFFLNTLDVKGGILTLTDSSESFIQRRLHWGLRLEVRDDLLNPEQIRLALQQIPHSQLLFSVRRENPTLEILSSLGEGSLWDWPAERPIPAGFKPTILSLHERKAHESVSDTGHHLETVAKGHRAHLKLAVEVQNFEELWQGHLWAAQDAKNRTFLPRSTDGRWSWYRLFMKDPNKLNFIREGEGSAPDQPYLLDWVRTPECPSTFAAVLGHPVGHSRTPAEHFEFFSKRKMPVVAIPVSETEWDVALNILQKLGLRAAAVTAPNKLKAAHSAKIKSDRATQFDSVNTLYWSVKDHCWVGENTDLMGLSGLFSGITNTPPFQKIAVWGGGGTLPLLQTVLPQAQFYSARTGTTRDALLPHDSPQIVIWGVGRSRYSEKNQTQWPNPNWKPTQVIDLNYSEDSPGREYALKTGAKYISGMVMFRAQAQAQREFWENLGL